LKRSPPYLWQPVVLKEKPSNALTPLNSSKTKFEFHQQVKQSEGSLIEFLSKNCQLSKSMLKECLDKGAVWVTRNKHTQRARRIKKPLLMGDTIHLYFDPDILSLKAKTLYLVEDRSLYSIWSKPCGSLSQGSKWGDHCTVARWVEKQLLPERPAFILHRLDKAACG